MPPPIPAHQKRFTANPTRPARYRPGKGVQEEESSEEGEDEEEEVQQPKQPQRKPQARPRAPPAKPQFVDEDDDDEEGFVTDEEDEADGGAPVPAPMSKSALRSSCGGAGNRGLLSIKLPG